MFYLVVKLKKLEFGFVWRVSFVFDKLYMK